MNAWWSNTSELHIIHPGLFMHRNRLHTSITRILHAHILHVLVCHLLVYVRYTSTRRSTRCGAWYVRHTLRSFLFCQHGCQYRNKISPNPLGWDRLEERCRFHSSVSKSAVRNPKEILRYQIILHLIWEGINRRRQNKSRNWNFRAIGLGLGKLHHS